MAGHYAHNAYMQAKVQVATDPKRLILMLYEGALEHLNLAREGLEEGNACKRGEHLSRTVAIVSELYTSLDANVADEPIMFLRSLYQAMLVELAQVAVTHEVQPIILAYRYLERLKQIWQHDVMGLQPGTAAEQASAPTATPASRPAGALPPAYGAAGPGLGQRVLSI